VRVSVIGSSGAGKTTVGRALAGRLGVRFVELDAIFHQRGWQPLPEPEFQARVMAAAAGDAWVIDGNYAAARPIVLARATTVVWLDLQKRVVMRQVIWRSVSRAVTRRELWNGNKESAATWVRASHPIRWSWTNFERKRLEYAARFASPEYRHLDLVRLSSRGEVRDWLGGD
jgi:adenylate kinase family enzyme